MKKFYLIIILVLIAWLSKSQTFFDDPLKEYPDGITIAALNQSSDSCDPRIFISDNKQVLYPCFYDTNSTSIDISLSPDDIKSIKKLLTFKLATEINKCCSEKNCPDITKGYFLMIKKGDAFEMIHIANNFLSYDLCGSKELDELILLLEKINKTYH